jgi:hypothetical protein
MITSPLSGNSLFQVKFVQKKDIEKFNFRFSKADKNLVTQRQKFNKSRHWRIYLKIGI